VIVRRGDASGSIIYDKTHTGRSYYYGGTDDEGFPEDPESGYSISIDDGVVDTNAVLNGTYTLQTYRDSSDNNSSTVLPRKSFTVEAPGFDENDLIDSSTTAGIWRDKDTGFTMVWGYQSTSGSSGDYNQYNYNHTFTQVYGVQITTITNRNDGSEWDVGLQSTGNVGKSSTTYTNTYFRATVSSAAAGFTWIAYGYTA